LHNPKYRKKGSVCIGLISAKFDVTFDGTPSCSCQQTIIKTAQNVPMPMYGYEILMMDGKTTRNMWIRNTIKIWNSVRLLVLFTRNFHCYLT